MSIGFKPDENNDTVLLVEDNTALRSELAEILSARGFNVLQADNGARAIKLIQEFDGDVHWLITDIILGEISGVHVAFEYRFHHPMRPIVIITAFAVPHELARLEGSVVLQKPFTAKQLANEMARLTKNAGNHSKEKGSRD